MEIYRRINSSSATSTAVIVVPLLLPKQIEVPLLLLPQQLKCNYFDGSSSTTAIGVVVSTTSSKGVASRTTSSKDVVTVAQLLHL